MMTSSPCWTSTLITLKMECLPPTLTTHSLASYEEPSSRLCQAQIASRSVMMPPAGVYFDLFSSIALIAALLMWSGVGKSGSPGPKSAISTPRDFSFSASEITAAVGEICMRLMRSVNCTVAPCGTLACASHSRNLCAQHLLDDGGHQIRQGRAVLRDFPHQLGTQVAVRFSGKHKHGLQPRFELTVHQRHLQLVFVIGNGADAAENHPGMPLARVVHQQAFEHVHFHVSPLLGDFAQHLH